MSFNPSAALACSSLPAPSLFGAEILSFQANQVTNYTRTISMGLYMNHGAVDIQAASFCNVSIAYTHPGLNDTVNVQVYLPSTEWNGRMQAIGGNGWQAGLKYVALAGMAAAMGKGYVSLSTDAGLGSSDSATWGLLSPGNPNRNLLQNLASTSLNDLAIIGKDITNKYYGTPPVYSYWTGCSQGGRQGMMLAQRFPEAFDGIAASSPAINWSGLFVGDLWAHVIMNTMNIYPHMCEMQAITAAAIKACDANDGLVDGIIADPDSCNFDPTSLVGTTINCTEIGENFTISPGAAYLTQAMWDGPRKSDNSSLFFGQQIGTVLSSDDLSAGGSLALTTCSSNETCTADPLSLLLPWIAKFVRKDDNTDTSNITRQEFDQLYHSSINEWSSIIGTNDPDLSQFRARGGKLLTYHGLADGIIPPNSTTSYYDSVTALDPNVHDFYRVFMAPGVAHCLGGPGAFPADTFDTMRAWIENGTVPETMDSIFLSNTAIKRTICPYPLKQTYDGVGNATANEGFSCQ
ncbi:uncharacterized protein EAE98_011919 [Botrytis deweyae]|uniref:Carboxylic ester hydrolase n=1 Tax=Botrytis deweyae TaxID=2478750 RepID=A0ABQ7I4J5_9HELO|nr:uncharacterized protein EAE98_011919 [Botrytis deweyae]KAF7911655.1 hypothetical protein EAE98_011919 [Botrytis deweyae]